MASIDDEEFEETIKLRLQRVVKEANKIQEDIERRNIQRQNSRTKSTPPEGHSASSSKNNTPSSSLEKKRQHSYAEPESRTPKDKDRTSRHSSGTGNRYFRESNFTIVDGNTDATLVQWYGHFVGQRLVREMEIRPGKKTRLLVSGRDDSRMKPETLDDSGLASKKGAEISNLEFENDWKRHGGEPYY